MSTTGDGTEIQGSEEKQLFKNKNNPRMVTMLRLKTGETLEAAVERLRRAGWEIPDLSKLRIEEDAVSKYLVMV